MRFSRIVVVLVSYCFILCALAEPLPIKVFGRLPDVSGVTLSPNGKLVASLVRVDLKNKKGTEVSLFDTNTKHQKYLLFTDNIKYRINRLHWANNNYLLVEVTFPYSRHGVPTAEHRLLKLNVTNGKFTGVLSKIFIKRLSYIPNILSTVIDYLPNDDDHIIMAFGGFSTRGDQTVVKVALKRSDKTYVIQGAKRDVFKWLTDSKHQVRIGIRRHKTHYDILEKQPSNSEFRTLWSFDSFTPEEVWPIGFGSNNNVLYVKALYQGKDAIYRVDLTDPSLTKKLVYFNEQYDVSGMIRYSQLNHDIIGISRHFWQQDYQHFQTAIDKALPDTKNYIINFSADERRYLLLATSDTEPGVYLVGDRDNNSLIPVAYRYAALSPELMSHKQPIQYKARDGLTIEGFLTLPKVASKKSLPTIIFPHGGPISYDTDDFDYWTQFLANQGYAVLQMNFRGSFGYGFKFMKQGIDGWGKAMQDDVEDGARWLIKQGIADKHRMCIVGASYGGYAALLAGIKTPDLYRCVVSFAGVSDVEKLLKSEHAYQGFEVVKKQLGGDYDALWQRSPLKYAKQMKPPVLLIHGSKDRNVRVRQSRAMYQALLDAHKDVQYVELKGGDHYLSNSQHRLTTFKTIAAFLHQHLN